MHLRSLHSSNLRSIHRCDLSVCPVNPQNCQFAIATPSIVYDQIVRIFRFSQFNFSCAISALSYGELRCQKQALNAKRNVHTMQRAPSPARINENGRPNMISFISFRAAVNSDAERKRMHLVDNFDNKHIVYSHCNHFVNAIITTIPANGRVGG